MPQTAGCDGPPRRADLRRLGERGGTQAREKAGGEGGEIGEDEVGFFVAGVSEAAFEVDGTDAGAAGGFEIGVVVADHPGVGGGMAGAPHGVLQGEGRGLEFGGVAAAEKDGEEGRPAEVVEEAPGVGGGLVGDEGEGVAGGAEGAQAGVDAGIGRGGVDEMLGVGGADFARGEIGIDGRAFEGAEGQRRGRRRRRRRRRCRAAAGADRGGRACG